MKRIISGILAAGTLTAVLFGSTAARADERRDERPAAQQANYDHGDRDGSWRAREVREFRERQERQRELRRRMWFRMHSGNGYDRW